MGILDEPVRGLIPPAWFFSLSGLDRMRVWFDQALPAPPATRLVGLRAVHFGPGFCTQLMPAGERATALDGQVDPSTVASSAVGGAMTTALAPGQSVHILGFSLSFFRPVRPGMGQLLARARIINASRLFVYADVLVEDSEGRQIAHGGGHAAIVPVDPPPPPVPSPLEPLEQPTWPTPDPWQRPLDATLPWTLWQNRDGIDILRDVAAGRIEVPILGLLGARLESVEPGHLTIAMPASEWSCFESRHVSHAFLTCMANLSLWGVAQTQVRAGVTQAGLDVHLRYLRRVPADGRILRVRARTENVADDVLLGMAELLDADGEVAVTINGSCMMIDASHRPRPLRRPVERELCTILFTDIVDSTARARAMGDRAWGDLLERHDEVARREVSQCRGQVVKSTGDGLLVRFASPARAVDCARRLVRALDGLGLQVRAGLHAGECEVYDDDVIGMAVHVASRIEAAARPGEVLVSSVVRDLASGEGLAFEDRGEHGLKGVDEPWRLWAVA